MSKFLSDDYLNLPNKVYNTIKTIHSLFPNIIGIYKTDDNVELNIDLLYHKLIELKHTNYWGHETTRNYLTQYSGHLINNHSNEISDNLFLLKKFPIKMNIDNKYCGGKGYFINNNSIQIIINNPQYFTIMCNTNNELLKYFKNKKYFENLCV